MKQIRKSIFIIPIMAVLIACGVATPVPTATTTTVPASALVIPTSTEPPPTFSFTLAPTLASLPTLTPIPNSTPASKGAYFDVPSDVLGSQYEIENAYYFDKPEAGERYEFYAGAIAGSGDEETAQGVVVLRILRFSEKDGNAEIITNQEYLIPIQAGPLRINVDYSGSILLFTPLHFEWTFSVRQHQTGDYPLLDLYSPPLARLESGEESQLAGRGSSCWKGTCGDFPISTSTVPLVVRSHFTAHLHLPLTKPPDGLSLYTMAVSPPGPLEYESVFELEGTSLSSWSSEKPGRELVNQGALLLRRDQDIKLALKPGYYVLGISATWREYGDVTYGFLIEVQE